MRVFCRWNGSPSNTCGMRRRRKSIPDSSSFLNALAAPRGRVRRTRAVNVLEIVDVAAIRRKLALRDASLDHPNDHPATALVPASPQTNRLLCRGGHLHAHPQRLQRAFLPHISSSGFYFRRGISGRECSPGRSASAASPGGRLWIFRIVRLCHIVLGHTVPRQGKTNRFFRRALL